MYKLVVKCEDEALLKHLLRGLQVDLTRFEITTTSPARKRAARQANESARITK